MNGPEKKNGPMVVLEDYLRHKQQGAHFDCQSLSLR